MSHITRVETKIYDRQILMETLKDLDCRFRENVEIDFEGKRYPTDIVVWKDGEYRVGFKQGAQDAPYTIRFYGMGRKKGRAFKDRVTQVYAKKKLLAEARRKNYFLVQETRCEGNRIRLVLRKTA